MLAKYGRALHGSRGNEKRHSISLEAEGGALTIGAAMGFEIILPHRVKNEEAPHNGGAGCVGVLGVGVASLHKPFVQLRHRADVHRL